MPFDAVGTITIYSGGRAYLSLAGAHDGAKYTVAANDDGSILLTPLDWAPVRPSLDELTGALEAMKRGRALGAELATTLTERATATARFIRQTMTDPTIAEADRGVIIGAALAEIDATAETKPTGGF